MILKIISQKEKSIEKPGLNTNINKNKTNNCQGKIIFIVDKIPNNL